uniref:protein mono-ADP-ribosyltransferase PARP16-like isoform X1 n=2 Tax=Styela clava TaxID=7725 RepID=UPI00193A00A8|nr:protein mono-ADP-ribosyltransferase PARP16-like isoform X1 [Styela clava]
MEPPAADLLWSFFMTALSSYRKDSVLRPFPAEYQDDSGNKDFDKLMQVATLCPPLVQLNGNVENVNADVIKLLRSVLNPQKFTLKILGNDAFPTVYKLLSRYENGPSMNTPKPDYIFEISYSATQEKKFCNTQGSASLLHAFHGTKIENFYSILNNGLKNNLNKVGLYGEGIYLSSDLSIALNYSPTGQGWDNSMFGTSISCVALCEMIDHPDVKCTLKYQRDSHDSAIQKEVPLYGNVRQDSETCFSSTSYEPLKQSENAVNRSKIKGSEGGEIPEKYFVVRNDDLVRVKYLLLYCATSNPSKTEADSSLIMNFIGRHQFLLSMLCYVILLLLASLCNSKRFYEWLNSFL